MKTFLWGLDMKRIHIYLGNQFMGTLLVDENADPRRIRNLVIKQLAAKMMPTLPIVLKHKSKSLYKKKLEEIRKNIKLVYEL